MFGFDDAVAAGLKVLDKFIPDPAAKAQAEKDLREALLGVDRGQLEVNKQEAASSDRFVSGWRPFIGWVCGAALAYQYLVAPIAMWGASWAHFVVPKPPTLDDTLWQLMFGLLGMGGLRTYEKIRGIAK